MYPLLLTVMILVFAVVFTGINLVRRYWWLLMWAIGFLLTYGAYSLGPYGGVACGMMDGLIPVLFVWPSIAAGISGALVSLGFIPRSQNRPVSKPRFVIGIAILVLSVGYISHVLRSSCV